MIIPNVTPGTLVTPMLTTNARNDTVYLYEESEGATRTPIKGWVQQRGVQSVGSSRNVYDAGRAAGNSTWILYTNQPGITRHSRLEAVDGLSGKIFQVDGEPYPTRSLSPGVDHYEVNLRLVEG
jgi:hypothetical protein